MRLMLSIAVLLSAAAHAPAQVNTNQFDKWDLTVEFTSRGANGGNPGHVSQGHSYGFTAGLQTLTRSQYTIQDQELSTQEVWEVGTCGLDGAGDPDYARKTLYASNLMLPTGSGIGAFIVTHNALSSNPHKIPQVCDQWHHVWNLRTMTNWSSDGLGVHMSQAATWMMTLLCGRSANNATGHREIPRTDGSPALQIVEGLGWSDQAQSNKPAIQDRAWRLTMWFDEPALYAGVINDVYNQTPCPNPNFGYASLDPDFNDVGSGQPGRYDDLTYRFNAGSAFASGAAVLLWSNAVFPAAIPTPFGDLYLDITDPLFGAVGAVVMQPFNSLGQTTHDVKFGASTSPFRSVMGGFANLSCQCVAISRSGNIKLSSLSSLRGILVPAGWVKGQAQQGQPLNLTRSIQQQTIVVRNDGRGVLTVQPKRGTSNIGPATTVCERVAVRIVVPAAANAVEIASPKTTPTELVYGWNQ